MMEAIESRRCWLQQQESRRLRQAATESESASKRQGKGIHTYTTRINGSFFLRIILFGSRSHVHQRLSAQARVTRTSLTACVCVYVCWGKHLAKGIVAVVCLFLSFYHLPCAVLLIRHRVLWSKGERRSSRRVCHQYAWKKRIAI